jgi:hypothetical protein
VAVDAMEQMGVCRSLQESDACVGDGLPSDTVFAAGANRQYLVAARRVRASAFGEAPRNLGAIEYYYVVRVADEAEHGLPEKNIVGPLTEREFNDAKQRLMLPEFTHVFDELR